MNKPSITPRPWHLGKENGIEYDGAVYGPNGKEIAFPIFMGTSEAKANARAISAVPDLLEALEAALPGLESDILYCERHPNDHVPTADAMLAHKKQRLQQACSALIKAGYTF